MANLRYVLLLATRVVPGVVFVDVIKSAVTALPKFISEPTTLALLNPELLLVPISGALALATVVTGSITCYATTLVALILTKLPTGFSGPIESHQTWGGYRVGVDVPWIGIVGLMLLLVVDSYATVFRAGASVSARPSIRAVASATTVFLALLAPFLAASAALSIYFSSIIGALVAFASGVESSPLHVLSGSYVAYVAIAVTAFTVLVKTMNSVAELAALFVLPSRKLSLKVLLDDSDINKAFSPPLAGTLLGLATLSFYPVVHALLFEVLFEVPKEVTARIGSLAPVVFGVISFLVTSLVVFSLVGKSLVFSHKRGIASTVIIFSLVYASAVKLSLQHGSDLLSSLVRPDFAGVVELVGKTYSNYAYYVLAFLESILRFLGVAP
ncbi:MAG: hypothetical protein QW422_07975 [Sulfolobales archaeon]